MDAANTAETIHTSIGEGAGERYVLQPPLLCAFSGYFLYMSHLLPEVRADVNGKLVTRHVKSGTQTPLKKMPLGTQGSAPVPVINQHLSRLVSPMQTQQMLRGSSPRQQAACRDALLGSNRGVELLATAAQRGNNAALAGTISVLSDDDLFSSEKSPGLRYTKLMQAASSAHLVGNIGIKGESMNLAEARPEVKERVREFVYLTDAVEKSGGKVTRELAELAFSNDGQRFNDIYSAVVETGVTDASSLRASLAS